MTLSQCVLSRVGGSRGGTTIAGSFPLLSFFTTTSAASARPQSRNSRDDRDRGHLIKDLSRDVARSDISRPRSRYDQKPRVGPFGGMNRREAPGLLTVAELKNRHRERRQATFSPVRPGRDQNRQTTVRRDDNVRTGRKGGSSSTDKSPDFKALKMHSALTTVSYGRRAEIKEQIERADDRFDGYDLLDSVIEAVETDVLGGMTNEAKPTPIQRLAIPTLLGRPKPRRGKPHSGPNEVLIAAETGSGKTLAYLIPLINAVKKADVVSQETLARFKADETAREAADPTYVSAPVVERRTGQPRAVILVPTAELVDQVAATAKRFSHHVKLRIVAISATLSPTVIRNRLAGTNGGGVDIVVSTPHLLASIANGDRTIATGLLGKVRHLVIDEADSLLDKSFGPTTIDLLARLRPTAESIVLVSATIPRRLDNSLREEFPDLVRLTSPNMHAIPRRVRLDVVDASLEPYRGNKDLACADVIWKIAREADSSSPEPEANPAGPKHILVFVNEREQTTALAEYLHGKGIDATAFNRDAGDSRSLAVLSDFTNAKPGTGAEPGRPSEAPAARFKAVRVLVTTDIASRGVDTTAVKFVVLYDVPRSTVDFIHRLGRTGRMGRRGRGIVIVGNDDRRDIVKAVRESMFLGRALI